VSGCANAFESCVQRLASSACTDTTCAANSRHAWPRQAVPIHQVRDTRGHSSATITSTYLRSRTDLLDDAFDAMHRAKIALVKNEA